MLFLAAFVANMISAGVVVRSSGILFVAIVDYLDSSAAETAWITATLMLCSFFLGKRLCTSHEYNSYKNYNMKHEKLSILLVVLYQ